MLAERARVMAWLVAAHDLPCAEAPRYIERGDHLADLIETPSPERTPSP